MENEAGRLADDNGGTIHLRASARERMGRNAMRGALGGNNTESASAHGERSPLLRRSSDEVSDEEDTGVDEDTPRPAWLDEYSQWDSLPWYRRPSVSDILVPEKPLGLNPF